MRELEINDEELAAWTEEQISIAEVVSKEPLTKRWKRLQAHDKQRAFLSSLSRFNMVPAGRRGGKTESAKRRLVAKALAFCEDYDGWFIAAAPTHGQAKRIYWRDLKALIPQHLLRGRPSESEMIIPLYNGADIQVIGMDVPERVEGRPLTHILLDEYGNMKQRVWTEHVRPALADTGGSADLIGVPEGRNHYYDLWKECLSDQSGEWAGFTWTTEEILPVYLGEERAKREIESAQRDLDPLSYDQEFRASFINFSGRAYYTFDASVHANVPLPYDPDADLILCFDFNVSPGVAAVLQEKKISMDGSVGDMHLQRTCVVGEIYIPDNSNTPAVCRKILEKYGEHRGSVRCYGDATGGARGSAKTEGSDWELIRKCLRPVFAERLRFDVPSENPPERSRVNAVNARFKAVDGTVKMLVDPRCKLVIKDFEGVPLLEGGSGEIDKKKDPKLTHISDAIGYYVRRKFPLSGGSTQVQQY